MRLTSGKAFSTGRATGHMRSSELSGPSESFFELDMISFEYSSGTFFLFDIKTVSCIACRPKAPPQQAYAREQSELIKLAMCSDGEK
jgi:hypothetical protein